MEKSNLSKNQSRNKAAKKFDAYTDCLAEIKKCVYMIVRGRSEAKKGRQGIRWKTLGTGFLAAPYRLLTANHVINDPSKGLDFKHQDGDKYYLIKHDDQNNWHYQIYAPRLDKEIFLYPKFDLGILHLNNEFYKIGGKTLVNKEDFIKVSTDFYPIGTEVGVLGYPMTELTFNNENMNKPKIGNVLLRTDKGVINSRYRTSEKTSVYEFTLNFNPGNSGGPIFNTRTGELISIVRGFKKMDIEYKERIIPENLREHLKEYKAPSFIEVSSVTYSFGLATSSFEDVFKDHQI